MILTSNVRKTCTVCSPQHQSSNNNNNNDCNNNNLRIDMYACIYLFTSLCIYKCISGHGWRKLEQRCPFFQNIILASHAGFGRVEVITLAKGIQVWYFGIAITSIYICILKTNEDMPNTMVFTVAFTVPFTTQPKAHLLSETPTIGRELPYINMYRYLIILLGERTAICINTLVYIMIHDTSWHVMKFSQRNTRGLSKLRVYSNNASIQIDVSWVGTHQHAGLSQPTSDSQWQARCLLQTYLVDLGRNLITSRHL